MPVPIESVIARIFAGRNIRVSAEAIPFDDPATYRLFSEGDTAGIPRFDHEDALDFLRRLAPDRFGHLVAFQALNRMSMIAAGVFDRYIERRHGREPSDCEIPSLTCFFAETHGLPLYEEQLARVGCDAAGFLLDETSRFARAFSRYDESAMPAMSARFLEGVLARGTIEPEAKAMLAFFGRTAAFTLPKSRLAAFAAEGYRMAWLKAHYRDGFESVRREAESPGGPRPLDISATPK